MSPADFTVAYRPTALQVSAGTGIDPLVLLAQWANETDWGAVVVSNNLGNIRCSPTTFCQYATLADFAADCAATFHNGYYGGVLSATSAPTQLAAIVASPWSGGHYGGSLDSFYAPLEALELTPNEHNSVMNTEAGVTDHSLAFFHGLGTPTPGNQFSDLFDAKLKAAAAAPTSVTVDLSPVLNALTAQKVELDGIAADVATMKRLVMKDLAP